MTHKGSCQCGAIAIEVTGEPALAAHCHCLDCQKSTGAGHLSFAFYPADKVKITGELSRYTSKTDQGNTMSRSFCPVCGSRVLGESSGFPGVTGVALGILDSSDDIAPTMSFYAKRARKWDQPVKGIPAFDELPPHE